MAGNFERIAPVRARSASIWASALRRFHNVREAIVAKWFVIALVCALFTAVLTLLWVGNHAFTGWQRSTTLLAQRRAEEKAILLSVALDRDMKAVQASGTSGGSAADVWASVIPTTCSMTWLRRFLRIRMPIQSSSGGQAQIV